MIALQDSHIWCSRPGKSWSLKRMWWCCNLLYSQPWYNEDEDEHGMIMIDYGDYDVYDNFWFNDDYDAWWL